MEQDGSTTTKSSISPVAYESITKLYIDFDKCKKEFYGYFEGLYRDNHDNFKRLLSISTCE